MSEAETSGGFSQLAVWLLLLVQGVWLLLVAACSGWLSFVALWSSHSFLACLPCYPIFGHLMVHHNWRVGGRPDIYYSAGRVSFCWPNTGQPDTRTCTHRQTFVKLCMPQGFQGDFLAPTEILQLQQTMIPHEIGIIAAALVS